MVQLSWLKKRVESDVSSDHGSTGADTVIGCKEVAQDAGVEVWQFDTKDGRQSTDHIKPLGTYHHRFDVSLTDSVDTNNPKEDLDQSEYEEELLRFEKPHFHLTDEVRLVYEGTCIYDVCTKDKRWLRIFLARGDGILIPAGVVHSVFLRARVGYRRCVKASGYYRSVGLDSQYIPRYHENEKFPHRTDTAVY